MNTELVGVKYGNTQRGKTVVTVTFKVECPEDVEEDMNFIPNLKAKVGQVFDIAADSLASETMRLQAETIKRQENEIRVLRARLASAQATSSSPLRGR